MLNPERNPAPLEQRALEVLRIVVGEHVRTGEPVSSRYVARFHPEQLSPATIRSIMADLTDQGFLEQPHTSAGRVPTDRGYRSFVDEILASQHQLRPDEAQRIEELLVSSREMEVLLACAGRLLGRLTNQVAVLLTPDLGQSVLDFVDFVRVAPRRVVAVFVGQGGMVSHRVVEPDEDLLQEELDQLAAHLREHFSGISLVDVRRQLIAALRADRAWADRFGRKAVGAMVRLLEDPTPSAELIIEGTSRLLDLPEFADVQRLRDILRAIDERSRLIRLLDRCLGAPGVQVIIGSETADPGMAPIAVVASPYVAGGGGQGLVGVLGPRRMEYARAVALVEHFARTLSQLMTDGGRERGRREK